MLNHLILTQKIVLLILFWTLITLGGYGFYCFTSFLENPFLILLKAYFEVFLLMLSGFSLFQIFKYLRLPKCYYERKNMETANYFKYLMVQPYQYILVHSFMRHANPRVYLKGKGRAYLKVFHEETKQSETSHIVSFFYTLIWQYIYISNGYTKHFYALCIMTLFLNIYPILLQRKNRFAIEEKFRGKTDFNSYNLGK